MSDYGFWWGGYPQLALLAYAAGMWTIMLFERWSRQKERRARLEALPQDEAERATRGCQCVDKGRVM